MMTTKEWQQAAEKSLRYIILLEKEKTMMLAYSTALRSRALLNQHTRQQVVDMPAAMAK